jgi:hypothetical protein
VLETDEILSAGDTAGNGHGYAGLVLFPHVS